MGFDFLIALDLQVRVVRRHVGLVTGPGGALLAAQLRTGVDAAAAKRCRGGAKKMSLSRACVRGR